MRVLYVVHDFLQKNVAGTELYTYYLAKELSQRHSVHLFFNFRDSNSKSFYVINNKYDGIPFTAVNSDAIEFGYSRSSGRDLVNQAFNNLLFEFSPDVVHFQHVLYLTPEIIKIAKSHGIPTVYTLHDFWLICHRIRMIRKNKKLCYRAGPIKCTLCYYRNGKKIQEIFELFKNLDFTIDKLKGLYWSWASEYKTAQYYSWRRVQEAKEIFKNIDVFISPSQFLRYILMRHGLPNNKIKLIHNGLTGGYNSNKPIRAKKRLQFGYMGGMNENKGFYVLMEAFSNILNADLNIFGHVDSSIQKGYAASCLNIYFHGVVTGLRKEKMLAELDVMVFPSIWFENAPLTIQEAYMIGAPVIASNIGGMKEFVIDGVTGLHFKVGSATDLNKKIKFLINNPQKIDEMKANLPRIKTIKENADEVEDIYKSFQLSQ